MLWKIILLFLRWRWKTHFAYQHYFFVGKYFIILLSFMSNLTILHFLLIFLSFQKYVGFFIWTKIFNIFISLLFSKVSIEFLVAVLTPEIPNKYGPEIKGITGNKIEAPDLQGIRPTKIALLFYGFLVPQWMMMISRALRCN